jgi:hypothetical protein
MYPSLILTFALTLRRTTGTAGQIHFFPVIMDAKVLDDVMTERIGKKQA